MCCFSMSSIKVAIIESFVALAVIKQLKMNMEVKFWRTGQDDEVDFILLKNRIPVPVGVKYRLSGPVVPDGVRKFLQHYPEAPFALRNRDNKNMNKAFE
jgi:predicted AAA+ superfamily ATPase